MFSGWKEGWLMPKIEIKLVYLVFFNSNSKFKAGDNIGAGWFALLQELRYTELFGRQSGFFCV